MIPHIETKLSIWAVTNGGGAKSMTGHKHATVLYKLMIENGTALPSMRSLSDYQPNDEIADQVEVAVISLPYHLKDSVCVRYIWGFNANEAAAALRISVPQFRKQIDTSHYFLAGFFAAQNRFQLKPGCV